MVKKASLMFVALLFIFANQVFAHTNLKDSNPTDGEIVEEPLREIHLYFETKVEQNSTFELKNSDGGTIGLEEISIEEKSISGVLEEPLDNGSYSVFWKIIGVDGHPIEGKFTFEVQLPQQIDQDESEQTKPPEQEPANQTAPEQAEQQKDPDKETERNNENKRNNEQIVKEQKSSTTLISSIVLILILIAIISIFWLIRRKNK
jgi:methionine-rich copper-binding protein CopC